jgi:hypothetical protein
VAIQRKSKLKHKKVENQKGDKTRTFKNIIKATKQNNMTYLLEE